MKLTPQHKPPLVVSLNTAWQKTLLFKHVTYSEVNRATQVKQCGGGKGINVVRVFRTLGFPVAFAGFTGGTTGDKVQQELNCPGVRNFCVTTQAETRCCSTVVSLDDGKVTELIEPSGNITDLEAQQMMSNIQEAIPDSSAVLFVGSVPPGIPDDFCAQVARGAAKHQVPFILDAVAGLGQALPFGCRLLKVNADELKLITGHSDLKTAAGALFQAYPSLEAVGVTDGSKPAWLFTPDRVWSYEVPALEHVVSPIGGGDCIDALVLLRISQGISPEILPYAFAEALACASASCLTDVPALFDPMLAEQMTPSVVIKPQ